MIMQQHSGAINDAGTLQVRDSRIWSFKGCQKLSVNTACWMK